MLRIPTSSAPALLKKIQDAVKAKKDPDGHEIRTWELDKDGKFRHTGEGGQWRSKGKLLGDPDSTGLDFLWEPAEEANSEAYGVCQGRFLELLINHFGADSKAVDFRDNRKK